MMAALQIVIATNVVFAGLRSQRGASHLLLQEIGRSEAFRIHLSVPLVLEYEEVAKRNSRALGLSHSDSDNLLDYLCSVAGLHDIYYLWRPCLTDPDDDMLLELAVVAECQRIVTFNERDFQGIERFGVRAISPQEFLSEIGVIR